MNCITLINNKFDLIHNNIIKNYNNNIYDIKTYKEIINKFNKNKLNIINFLKYNGCLPLIEIIELLKYNIKLDETIKSLNNSFNTLSFIIKNKKLPSNLIIVKANNLRYNSLNEIINGALIKIKINDNLYIVFYGYFDYHYFIDSNLYNIVTNKIIALKDKLFFDLLSLRDLFVYNINELNNILNDYNDFFINLPNNNNIIEIFTTSSLVVKRQFISILLYQNKENYILLGNLLFNTLSMSNKYIIFNSLKFTFQQKLNFIYNNNTEIKQENKIINAKKINQVYELKINFFYFLENTIFILKNINNNYNNKNLKNIIDYYYYNENLVIYYDIYMKNFIEIIYENYSDIFNKSNNIHDLNMKNDLDYIINLLDNIIDKYDYLIFFREKYIKNKDNIINNIYCNSISKTLLRGFVLLDINNNLTINELYLENSDDIFEKYIESILLLLFDKKFNFINSINTINSANKTNYKITNIMSKDNKLDFIKSISSNIYKKYNLFNFIINKDIIIEDDGLEYLINKYFYDKIIQIIEYTCIETNFDIFKNNKSMPFKISIDEIKKFEIIL